MGEENPFSPQLKDPFATLFLTSDTAAAPSINPAVDDFPPFSACQEWEIALSNIFCDAARNNAHLLSQLFSFVAQIDVNNLTDEAEAQDLFSCLSKGIIAHTNSSADAFRAVQDLCFWIVKQKLVPRNVTCTLDDDETAEDDESKAFTEKSQPTSANPLFQNNLSKAAENTALSRNEMENNAHSDFDGIWWDDDYFADELQKDTMCELNQLDEANQLEKLEREFEKQAEQQKALVVPENSLVLSVDTFVWDESSAHSCIVAMPKSRKKNSDGCSLSLICQEVMDSSGREHLLSVEDEAIKITAKQIVHNFLENFNFTDNNFPPRTAKKQEIMINDIRKVAAYFLAKNSQNSEILELNADREVLCGDVRGSFSSFHMTFMRTIPRGEWYSPSVSMLCLGGYSGECEHSVEVVALLLALHLLYPQLIYIMHSRLDEKEVTGDFSNPCSLRACCRKFCTDNDAGDTLWHSLTDAVCATPVAAVVRQSFFAAHIEPGSCREAPLNDAETPPSDLRPLLDSYCKRPEDVLSHPNIAAVIVAGPLPECCEEANEHLLADRILYFSGSFSSYKGWNGPPNTAQACLLSSGKITVFRWYQHHVLHDDTEFTKR